MKKRKHLPPEKATRFLEWFLKDDLVEEVVGDLEEKFQIKLEQSTPIKAKLNYWIQVIHYLRPFAIRTNIFSNLNPFFMWQHHLKISWRTLIKHKGFSIINIGGLAIGMTVAMLLGLWVHSEISYDKNFENLDHIAQVIQHRTIGDDIQTWYTMPFPMGDELELNHKHHFKHVVKSSYTNPFNLEYKGEKFLKSGDIIQSHGIEMLAPKMLHGNWKALEENNSIILNRSLSKTIFGSENPIGKTITFENEFPLKVTGIFEDFPEHSSYSISKYFVSWDIYLKVNEWVKNIGNPWGNNSFLLMVQKKSDKSFAEIRSKMKDVLLNKVKDDQGAFTSRPQLDFLPLKDWYLNASYTNGVQNGGRLQYVWLFGLIGIFVLLLACINFMNLSTARSEKRAKEVGVRKAIGSKRSQLIYQFFMESILVSVIAFILSLSLVQLILPWFNEIADKTISLSWNYPLFWIGGLGFALFTGLLAGSYPALYLSSFNAIKALKGTFRIGRFATIPRKILVVIQFSVSIALIVGTVLVYQQIQYGQDRPLGYAQNNLVYLRMNEGNIRPKYQVIEQELKASKAVTEMAFSTAPVTRVWSTNGGLNWTGKDPDLGTDFPFTGVSHDYGKTVGWEFIKGRDFDINKSTDSTAIVVNEAAIRFMQLENPIGEVIDLGDEKLTIIGVTKDMVIESPYRPIRPHYYYIPGDRGRIVHLKLNPDFAAKDAIRQIETTVKEHIPKARMAIKFVDEDYNKKFHSENRVATLSGIFSLLAIFISCLGLFGLASYMAERRNKEISIRKILGASILNLWGMLSKDFVFLVLISFLIAIPIAYYFMYGWLENYEYRIDISWKVFVFSGIGALMLTLCTVSFQAIKAATANPVNALKQE